jgi:VanZ family protein
MIWSRVGFIIVLAAITIGSLLPPRSVASAGSIPDWVQHGLGYFLLALFAALVFDKRSWQMVLGCVIAYGVLIEVLQPVVAGRNFELSDMLANAIGAGLGFAVAKITTYRFRSPRQ